MALSFCSPTPEVATRFLVLGAMCVATASFCSAAAVWDPRIRRYEGYDLASEPVLYEAYYPDGQEPALIFPAEEQPPRSIDPPEKIYFDRAIPAARIDPAEPSFELYDRRRFVGAAPPAPEDYEIVDVVKADPGIEDIFAPRPQVIEYVFSAPRKPKPAEIASIEVSGVAPRHKTRHHHGEWWPRGSSRRAEKS